ncbi:ArsR family transcriptional regulator [Nitrosopumilus sp. K4]|uniref:helix-turn-helix transcriptional regulator n=1 Tax=Nitrosopumilus sp. K4 TaxID=2795383 RepID=UPI001BADDF21|nr:ArsR family transcriptional regulator [Nitrosopumilus sp. K4]QUC63917.1 ArsR family transcriptional regulator [Nitrosopumilus sp. K4]
MKNSHLLHDIVGDTSLKILHILSKKPMKSTSIAKQLKISFPGTQRHLLKLQSLNLIKKNSDYCLSLTERGMIALDLLSGFDFLQEKQEYLKNHSLMFLPSKFIKRIGDLQNCKVSRGFVNNIELYKKIILHTKEYVKHCTNVISLDTYKIAIPHFKKHDVKMSFILAKDMTLPPGWKSLQGTLGEEQLVRKGLMERRMIDKLNIMMWVSEDLCSLIFPGVDGELDLRTMLVSSDDSFREWCLDYFDYLWNQSHGFVQNYVYENSL